ncbi:Mediator of RNA polymerase II transcription subunit 23 [Lunasporangiospora selenospora]|uniref:Mediator of RNA polymerase II transcription subunit 23 n=1 Tax=Lunasporangiospora selenospora TaxID=979761 RepID=A0A9P6KIC9_9FUNG|nr:Mediator of RNA polymerase II transcription subunit 23 [Lunasporangiospora selenospora]
MLPIEILLHIVKLSTDDLQLLHRLLTLNHFFFELAAKLIYADPGRFFTQQAFLRYRLLPGESERRLKIFNDLFLGSLLLYSGQDPQRTMEVHSLEPIYPITTPFLATYFKSGIGDESETAMMACGPRPSVNYSSYITTLYVGGPGPGWDLLVRLQASSDDSDIINDDLDLQFRYHELLMRYLAPHIRRLEVRVEQFRSLTWMQMPLKMSSLQTLELRKEPWPELLDGEHCVDAIRFIWGHQMAFPGKSSLDLVLSSEFDMPISGGLYSTQASDTERILFQLHLRLILYIAVESPRTLNVSGIPFFYHIWKSTGISVRKLQKLVDTLDRVTLTENGRGIPGRNEDVATNFQRFLQHCHQLQKLSIFVSHVNQFNTIEGNQGDLLDKECHLTTVSSLQISRMAVCPHLRDLSLWTTRPYKIMVGALNDAVQAFSRSLHTLQATILSEAKPADSSNFPCHDPNDQLPSVSLSRRCNSIGFWTAPFLREITLSLRGAVALDVGSFSGCPQLEKLSLGYRIDPFDKLALQSIAVSDSVRVDQHPALPPWLNPFKLFPKWELPQLRNLDLTNDAALRFNYESLENGMPKLESLILQEHHGRSILGDLERIPKLSRHIQKKTRSIAGPSNSCPEKLDQCPENYSQENILPSVEEAHNDHFALDGNEPWINKWSLPSLRTLIMRGRCSFVFSWDKLEGLPSLTELNLHNQNGPTQRIPITTANLDTIESIDIDNADAFPGQQQPLFTSRLEHIVLEGKWHLTPGDVVKVLVTYAPNVSNMVINIEPERWLNASSLMRSLLRALEVASSKEYVELTRASGSDLPTQESSEGSQRLIDSAHTAFTGRICKDMQAFTAQLELTLNEADQKLVNTNPGDVDNFFCIFQVPVVKKRRLNPSVSWTRYLSDPDNSKCLTSLAGDFLKACKSLDSADDSLVLLIQKYNNSLQSPSPAKAAFLLALLYNIFHPTSALPIYDRIKSPVSLGRSFVQLIQHLDVTNHFQWMGTMALLLRCLQQPDGDAISPETATGIIISLLKKINILPLNCNQDQRESAAKGLEVIRAFLESQNSSKGAHATYYDLLREIPQVFPPGVVVHWTLEPFMKHLQRRRQGLAALVMPPDASWPLISQVSRQHEFTNLIQRPGYLMFAPDYANAIRDGQVTTNVSLLCDLIYQRAPSDEIFFMIRQLPPTPSGISAVREAFVSKTRDVVRCIQRHSRFHEPRNVDMLAPVYPNPEMVIPDNLDFMEILMELSDQLYAFVGSELSQISSIYPTGFAILYEDLINDYHTLVTATDKQPPELEKDNALIFLLLQLIHLEKVGGKDKLLAQDYAGDEHLFRLLISLYNEDQVNSKDGFYLRDLALQCAITHQQGYIRDRSMMKFRHPRLAVIWPHYSQICYNIQTYFMHKYKNNVQDMTSLSNLPLQENVKIAMESQLKQHLVAGTLFIYLVPNYLGKEIVLDPSGMFLKGGALSYKLLDLLNIDTKHRLLGLIYKMMLDGEQGPRIHGDSFSVKFVSPYVMDVVYKLLSTTPCAVEPVLKVLFDKLRRYDRTPKTVSEIPVEVVRWQFTVLQLLNFRLIRSLKFTATCPHLLHYMKFSQSMAKHRGAHNLIESCNHSAMSIQTSHKFLRSLVDQKREKAFWFEESEALARRAVLTVARIVKLRGQGDAPLGQIRELLQILHKHPLSGQAQGIPGAVTEEEVSTLLEGTSVHNVLLVPKGTEPNTFLLSHYADMANHPFFLCVFWEIIVIHQHITEFMLDDIRAVMLQFPPSHMSTHTQQLIDYALWKLDPKNPNASGSIDFVVRMFEDLVWNYQLLSIEHVLLALMTGHPARSGDLGLKVLIQMTIHSQELTNRISLWTSIGISPRPWEEDNYYEKLHSYLAKYPEYFGFEAHAIKSGTNPIQPPLEMPLLVMYNNVLLRLLNIFDLIIARFIEYKMNDALVMFLDKFTCLYLYHNTPIGFVRDTLLYYYGSPTLQDPRVMKSLLKVLDVKQVELCPVLMDYIQELSRGEDQFDENYVYDVCRKLALATDPKECGYKTDPVMPERHYREIANPATQGLYIAIIETLASPIPKEKFVASLMNLVLAKRRLPNHQQHGVASAAAAGATASSSTGSTASAPSSSASSKVVPEARVLHAAGLLLSALPKDYTDMFFNEVDAFVRVDQTLLQASTKTLPESSVSFGHPLHGSSGAANPFKRSNTGLGVFSFDFFNGAGGSGSISGVHATPSTSMPTAILAGAGVAAGAAGQQSYQRTAVQDMPTIETTFEAICPTVS